MNSLNRYEVESFGSHTGTTIYFLLSGKEKEAHFEELPPNCWFVKVIDKFFFYSKKANLLSEKEEKIILKLSKCKSLVRNESFWKKLFCLRKDILLELLEERVEKEYIIERLRGKRE